MNSDVAIVNMALTRLGQARLSSLAETGKNAQLCNLHYNPTKEELLTSQAYDFKFSRERASLAESAELNLTKYQYKYMLPSDCLKVLTIIDSEQFADSTDPWIKEGKFLYSDTSPCYIKYTKVIENPTEMPQTFIEALYLRLASKVCVSITQDQKLFGTIMQEYSAALIVAMAFDGGSSFSDPIPESRWSE